MDKFLLAKKYFEIVPLQACDSISIQHIHQCCFTPYWEKQTFDNFFKDQSIFGYKVHPIHKPDQILGFCLYRLILDEAEIITIAVHHHYQRQRIGHLLLDSTFYHLHKARAIKLFLEVEETNISALNLYQRFGFQKITKRPSYYQSKNGCVDAIIMQKTFQQID
ncbi:ribosomal protein S18-alanine N-acetyltransferase [Bartonella sp. CB189]|uniref:ribosomal protein S18-alanine N-acetyltransferase n=1 Tax=Bartonella sp. CB189 TaxID=3112254 RepID=UPI002F965631